MTCDASLTPAPRLINDPAGSPSPPASVRSRASGMIPAPAPASSTSFRRRTAAAPPAKPPSEPSSVLPGLVAGAIFVRPIPRPPQEGRGGGGGGAPPPQAKAVASGGAEEGDAGGADEAGQPLVPQAVGGAAAGELRVGGDVELQRGEGEGEAGGGGKDRNAEPGYSE